MTDDLSLLAAAGLAAAALSLIDPIPYVRDVWGGRTRPHRGSWLIWSVLAIVVFWSQWADGATWSLAMVAAQAVSTTAIFVLSIRNGQGGLRRAEIAMLLLAAAGVVGWSLSSEPIVATGFVVLADTVGFALMLPKTWRAPWSETRSTYVLAALSGALGLVAVGTLDVGLILYPASIVFADGLTSVVITVRRKSLDHGPTGFDYSRDSASQRRAFCHSRRTVLSETPRASPTSSRLMPAK